MKPRDDINGHVLVKLARKIDAWNAGSEATVFTPSRKTNTAIHFLEDGWVVRRCFVPYGSRCHRELPQLT